MNVPRLPKTPRVSPQLEKAIAATRSLEAVANRFFEISHELPALIYQTKQHAEAISGIVETPEVARVFSRTHRLIELVNMAELGSFSIEINRARERAWKELNR